MKKLSKAVGQRGSWFAEVDGVSYACVHKIWARPWPNYCDPNYFPNNNQAQEAFKSIQKLSAVILTDDDEIIDDDGRVTAFQRTGYIAIYQIENLSWEGTNLRFKFSSRLKELK